MHHQPVNLNKVFTHERSYLFYNAVFVLNLFTERNIGLTLTTFSSRDNFSFDSVGSTAALEDHAVVKEEVWIVSPIFA